MIYPDIAKKDIEESSNILNKLIYLRRLLEYQNEKGPTWDLLSNIFHIREVPMKKADDGSMCPMTEEEVTTATNCIKLHISDFNYQTVYHSLSSISSLISLYDSAETNYEKLQIYRLTQKINQDRGECVIQKFINETYHVESDYIFQLDPRVYDTVPQYIIDICNQTINELRETQHA